VLPVVGSRRSGVAIATGRRQFSTSRTFTAALNIRLKMAMIDEDSADKDDDDRHLQAQRALTAAAAAAKVEAAQDAGKPH